VVIQTVRIFLIHSTKDAPIGRIISDSLRVKGLETSSQYDIYMGIESWAEDVEDIVKADVVLVIVTEAFRNSDRSQKEVVYAQHGDVPIVPILIGETHVPLNLLNYNCITVGSEEVLSKPKFLDSIAFYLSSLIKDSDDVVVAQDSPENITLQEELVQDSKRILTDDPLDRVFIAYSRKQRYLAQELCNLLTKNGKAIFWDAKLRLVRDGDKRSNGRWMTQRIWSLFGQRMHPSRTKWNVR
jgi:hypothetical protein